MMLPLVALAPPLVFIIQWVVIDYSLAFGTDVGGFIGNLEYCGLKGITIEELSGGIPDMLFICFQMMFVYLALDTLTSGVVGRVKMSAFLLVRSFSSPLVLPLVLTWLTLVYTTHLDHWAWGGGWVGQLGVLDFAGGTVVHISSGFAALALVIGKRIGY